MKFIEAAMKMHLSIKTQHKEKYLKKGRKAISRREIQENVSRRIVGSNIIKVDREAVRKIDIMEKQRQEE